MAGTTLLRARAHGTLFRGRQFFRFDWGSRTPLDAGERNLDELHLPSTLLPGVDAACVNPLDPDVLWFFCGDEVVDYRVSKGRPIAAMTSFDGNGPATVDQPLLDSISRRKIKDHPIFRVLPAAFQSGVTGLALNPRTYADAGGHTDAPPVITSPSVVVTPTGDGGALIGGGAMVVVSGETAQLWHSVRFVSPGKYTAEVSLDTGTGYGTTGSDWKISLAESAEEPPPQPGAPTPQPPKSIVFDVPIADFTTDLIVVVQASPGTLPRRRLVLIIKGPSPAATVLYERRLMLSSGPPPAIDGLPLVYVFKGTAGLVLQITSLRTAVALAQPTTIKAAADALFNGAGTYGDRIYQLSGGDVREHVQQPGRVAFVAEVPQKTIEKWCLIFKDGKPPQAGVPVELGIPVPGQSGATPGAGKTPGSSVIATGVDLDPPETLVAIPGQHPTSLGTDFATWEKNLDPCSLSSPGGAQYKLVTRMRSMIDRITTTDDLPDFLRTFVAVRVAIGTRQLCYYAMPDFFSAGTETQFLRLPLTGLGGQKVIDWYEANKGCHLVQTTGKIALQIAVAPDTQRMHYVGMGGEDRNSTDYVRRQQVMTEAERAARGFVLGALTAGHRKEVVVSADQHKPGDIVYFGKPPKPFVVRGGVVFWGGLLAFETPGNVARGVAPSTITVAHPGFTGVPAGSEGPHPPDTTRLFNGEEAHLGEPDHDEYAQGRRVIHAWAWFRDTARSLTWTSVDVRNMLVDKANFDLLSDALLPKPRYPQDFDVLNQGKV